MANKEAAQIISSISVDEQGNFKPLDTWYPGIDKDIEDALKMAIKALENEPLTDIEQRIFLAAMSREENACKDVCADGSDDGVNLVAVCHRIERKVKRVLWGK